MIKLLAILAALLTVHGCDKASESPQFDPEKILNIKGQFLKDDGTALVQSRIHMRNFRYLGFVDYAKVVAQTIVGIAQFPVSAYSSPWYFFPFGVDRILKKAIEDNTELPNFFLDSLVTDDEGKFDFNIRAGNFIRDSSGGINIQLINSDPHDGLYGKHVFVVKAADSDLGTLRLCELGGVRVAESPTAIRISWELPENPVSRFNLNVADAGSKALAWSQNLEGTEREVEISKLALGTNALKIGVEAFFKDDEQLKASCLSRLVDFQVESPIDSKIKGSLATAEGVRFRISSLTNGKFDDLAFFQAYSVKSFVLDLTSDADPISTIVLNNLRLSSAGQLEVSCRENADAEFQLLHSQEAARFMQVSFAQPMTCRQLKFQFSSDLIDLKEVSAR